MTAEEKKFEAEKKKKQQLKVLKEKRKKTETLEARMGQVIKPTKDPKLAEQQKKFKAELEEYIKKNIIEQMIMQA